MSDQRDLFATPDPLPRLPYQRTSDASRDAARRAARSANDQHKRIMRWMDGRTDGTRSEMAEREPFGTGLPINVVTPRVWELIHTLGYIRELAALEGTPGDQRVRTKKRNGSTLLVLTERGRGYLDRKTTP